VRTEKLEVRATAEELARYQAAARWHAMTLSAWVRMVLEKEAQAARVLTEKHVVSRGFAPKSS
jgi:hypothetical protein